MKILVIGGGGREHAICSKLAQSSRKPKLYCAPGNAGISQVAKLVPISAEDNDALLAFAKEEAIDLTVVGPEDPLCNGIVDLFEAAGLRIFGPCAAAARLEGDKSFAKELMREAGVPTAESRTFGPTSQELAQSRQAGSGQDEETFSEFQSGYDMARKYIETREEGIVVKAAGLAKGKGVFVHATPADALPTIESLMKDRTLGEAGARVVVEDLLSGPEVSILALVDGRSIYILESASDYKRLGEEDTGPNTGGMGSYSPSDSLSEADLSIIERDVFVPVVDALARIGVTYRGVLYAGIMLTAAGPKVLEFNCRFGDPETQAVLMRLQSDLVEALEATVDGRLDQIELKWDRQAAVCVVMASGGYPGSYEKGRVIHGLEDAAALDNVEVQHAGTILNEEGEVVTNGGRVLSVTALGDEMQQARQRAYEGTEMISFEGVYLRGDIAMRVSKR